MYLDLMNKISEKLFQRDSSLKPEDSYEYKIGEAAPLSYLLWMIEEVKKFEDRGKADRWLGWILAHMEFRGFWNNTYSRDLVREEMRQNNG